MFLDSKVSILKKGSDSMDDEDINFNELYDCISTYGIKVNVKGDQVMDTEHIYINNYQILINASLFRNHERLLKQLLKLSKYTRTGLLRIIMESIIESNLDYQVSVDLTDIDITLKNDI